MPEHVMLECVGRERSVSVTTWAAEHGVLFEVPLGL